MTVNPHRPLPPGEKRPDKARKALREAFSRELLPLTPPGGKRTVAESLCNFSKRSRTTRKAFVKELGAVEGRAQWEYAIRPWLDGAWITKPDAWPEAVAFRGRLVRWLQKLNLWGYAAEEGGTARPLWTFNAVLGTLAQLAPDSPPPDALVIAPSIRFPRSGAVSLPAGAPTDYAETVTPWTVDLPAWQPFNNPDAWLQKVRGEFDRLAAEHVEQRREQAARLGADCNVPRIAPRDLRRLARYQLGESATRVGKSEGVTHQAVMKAIRPAAEALRLPLRRAHVGGRR